MHWKEKTKEEYTPEEWEKLENLKSLPKKVGVPFKMSAEERKEFFGDKTEKGPNGSPRKIVPDYEPCGARRRNWKKFGKFTLCKRPVVQGKTRCKLHGGMSPVGPDHPRFLHGRNSKYATQGVIEKIDAFKKNQNARDLRDELAILRGILQSYIESADKSDPILKISSINTICNLVAKIEKVTTALKVIEEGHTFTIKNVNNVLVQIVRIIKTRVKDADERTAIARDLKGLSYISMN